jgi:hypothetical protein
MVNVVNSSRKHIQKLKGLGADLRMLPQELM